MGLTCLRVRVFGCRDPSVPLVCHPMGRPGAPLPATHLLQGGHKELKAEQAPRAVKHTEVFSSFGFP